MNRQLRRLYNKKNKTHYTKEDFDVALALARLRNGEFSKEDFAHARSFVHMDNTEIAPDGCEVKLNYEAIMSRPQQDLTDEFKNWVEENKDFIFHLTRDEAENSMVCVEEDNRQTMVDGILTKKPKWLFDLFVDLLVKRDDKWVSPLDIEEAMDGYTELKEV